MYKNSHSFQMDSCKNADEDTEGFITTNNPTLHSVMFKLEMRLEIMSKINTINDC